jgi:hypothetical protein
VVYEWVLTLPAFRVAFEEPILHSLSVSLAMLTERCCSSYTYHDPRPRFLRNP